MTPQQIEAMKMALEALEYALNKPMWNRPKMTVAITAIKEALAEHAMREVQRLGQEIEQNSMSDEMLQAITDPENQPSQYGTVTLDYHFEKIKKWEDLFERMSNKVLQQLEQEPVISKWVLREVYFDEDGEPVMHRSPPQPKRHELQAKGEHPAPCARHCEANAFRIVIKNLKAQLSQPEQEPVAMVESVAIVVSESENKEITMSWWHEPALPVGTKLYTTPPQRNPLTDEEMKKIWYAMQNIMGWYSFQEIARAIEAAHGIKE